MDPVSRFGGGAASVRSEARALLAKSKDAPQRHENDRQSQRRCTKNSLRYQKQRTDNKDRASKPKKMTRPNTILCHMCGQQFGTASIHIHFRSCQKRMLTEQTQLPSEFRKKIPDPPDFPIPTRDSTEVDFQKYNDAAAHILKTKVMYRCHKCGRTFSRFEKVQQHIQRCNSKVMKVSHQDQNETSSRGEGGVVLRKWKSSKLPLAKAIAATRGVVPHKSNRNDEVKKSKNSRIVTSSRTSKSSALLSSNKIEDSAIEKLLTANEDQTLHQGRFMSEGRDINLQKDDNPRLMGKLKNSDKPEKCSKTSSAERQIIIHVAGIHGNSYYQKALAQGIQVTDALIIPHTRLTIDHHSFDGVKDFSVWKRQLVKVSQRSHHIYHASIPPVIRKNKTIENIDRLESVSTTIPFVWTESAFQSVKGGQYSNVISKFIGDHTDMFAYLLQLQRKGQKINKRDNQRHEQKYTAHQGHMVSKQKQSFEQESHVRQLNEKKLLASNQPHENKTSASSAFLEVGVNRANRATIFNLAALKARLLKAIKCNDVHTAFEAVKQWKQHVDDTNT